MTSSGRPCGRRTVPAALLLAATASAQGPDPSLIVTPVAEKTVSRLEGGPLHWRVERFGDAEAAKRGAGRDALLVHDGGAVWRFTLGAARTKAAGTPVATIGPVPVPAARRFLLRVNRATGVPGATTPIHTHPGSESFYVLAGSLCQRTRHGVTRLDAGRAMGGHLPGMAMKLTSCGTVPLDQFVMFVVDADKPFSSPAAFD